MNNPVRMTVPDKVLAFAARVAEEAANIEQRTGIRPTHVWANPRTTGGAYEVCGIEVRPTSLCPQDRIWLGADGLAYPLEGYPAPKPPQAE